MKNLNIFAKYLNTDIDTLKTALESEEGADILKDMFDGFKNNHKKIGEKIGSDLAIKSIKEKTGVEFEGKDIDTFVSVFTDKIKKSIPKPESDNKEIELVKEQLKIAQNTITTKDSEISQLKSKHSEMEFDGYLSNLVPNTLPKGIERREALQIIKMNLPKFEKKDDRYITEKFDDNGNVISLDTEINNFVKARGWNEPQQQAQGGRGGEGKSGEFNGGNGLKTFSAYEKYLVSKNIPINTPEAAKILDEAMLDKNFNLNA